jgi:ketosteroid isomerase-like protein
MDHASAIAFAERWKLDWNAHDLNALLAHFTDDVVFTSPIAAQVLPGSDGTLRGKDELRHYWAEGLRRIPALRFEVQDVYVGVDTVVINYRNHVGNLVNEVLIFHGPLVGEGHATYLVADAAAASGVVGAA